MSDNCQRYFMSKNEILNCAEEAFRDRHFCVYYQPQFNHINGRIVGAEALVRWIHPEYGMQSPGDFIPAFEANGYITRLDLYVFDEVCAFIEKCIKDDIKNIVPVSFNVSRHDIYCNDFIDEMEKIRKKHNVPVHYLRVEITESAVLGSNDYLAGIVDTFHSLGYIVEMDDFGSGYSSLNVLKDIEVDIIKLDMFFLKGEIGGRGGVIISSVVRMANWLATPIIVEGVETVEQADYMKSLGCVYIQGYLYSKPVPEDEYLKLLLSGRTGDAVPTMKIIDKLDAEKFWSPETFETLIFNYFVGGAGIFSYENDQIEMLRVNEKYVEEFGMNMTQRDIIQRRECFNFDEENRKIFIDTIRRAIQSNDEEKCETWRTVHSPCCGDDLICIRSNMRVIGRADGQYLLFVNIQNVTAEKKMYAELYESEKKFRTAGEHANIYCWEYDIDTKEMRPCARCIRDLGMPKIVKNYPEPVIESGLFPADYADMYRDWMKQLEEGADNLEAIIPLTADRIPFHVRYTAEFDDNGRPYKAYGSATLVVDGEK
ncbi:MAG: EAL domain-containing protein [Oscillospiraceae bacterium]|nr:EAL domain-containing protein [Oscillospiraceae bacterium]